MRDPTMSFFGHNIMDEHGIVKTVDYEIDFTKHIGMWYKPDPINDFDPNKPERIAARAIFIKYLNQEFKKKKRGEKYDSQILDQYEGLVTIEVEETPRSVTSRFNDQFKASKEDVHSAESTYKAIDNLFADIFEDKKIPAIARQIDEGSIERYGLFVSLLSLIIPSSAQDLLAKLPIDLFKNIDGIKQHFLENLKKGGVHVEQDTE